MASFAPGSHVAAVDIGVAVTALSADIAEHRFQVALRACNSFVHAAKWVAGLAVIELRYLANRSPAAEGVAILAGNIQRTVWAPSRWHWGSIGCRLLFLRRSSQC